MRLFKYLSLILVIFFGLTMRCFSAQELNLNPNLLPDFPSNNYRIYDDLTKFVTTPALLTQHSVYLWTIPTLILYAFDEPLDDWYERNKYNVANMVPVSDNLLYESIKHLYLLNSMLENDDLRRFVFCEGEALVDALFLAQSMKHVFGRARPNANLGKDVWGNYSDLRINSPYTSFPSSHATLYFTASSVLGKAIKNEWLGDAIGAACFFSMTEHYHWASDIFVGYLLGKAIAGYVWDKKAHENLKDQWLIYPSFISGVQMDYPAICVIKYF